jgi:hypothetical protein
MLSWLRVEKLIRTLEILGKNVEVNAHLDLRVQGSEKLSDSEKSRILDLASKFTSNDVSFTEGNEGTARPRKEQLKKFLNDYKDVEYLMFADDDVEFTPEAIPAGVNYLMAHPFVGGVGIWHKENGFVEVKSDKIRINSIQLQNGANEVSVLGSGHSIFRREALSNIEIDEDYYIGAWDWDMTLQMSRQDWKLVILKSDRFRAYNHGGGTKEYNGARHNKEREKGTVKKFKTKFGIG